MSAHELRHRSVIRLEVDREALATRAKDTADESIPVTFSSEYAVERYDWWKGERYLEVLDHSPESIDLSRARNGLPFIDTHDARVQLGRVENIRLGTDRRMRGDLRFSRRAQAQEARQDILDGIRAEVSVGYTFDPNNLEREQSAKDVMPTVRLRRWTPYEVSSVAIPADPTVGVGRADPHATPESSERVSLLRLTTPAAPKAEEHTMSDTLTATPPGGAASAAVQVTRSEDPPEIAQISTMAEQHGLTERLPEWIRSGRSLSQVTAEINAVLSQRLKDGPQVKPPVTLDDREEQEYSFVRAIMVANGDFDGDCLERRVSDEISKKLPVGYKPKNGFFIPTNHRRYLPQRTRAGLDSKTATTGQELKFTQYGGFIDMLRARARVLQAGATSISGLNAPTTFVKQNGAGTFTWVAENPGSDVGESNLTLTTVTLTPKTGQSTTSFSRQLLRLGVEDAESMVRNDLVNVHALGIDAAALYGTGASNQPQGVYTASGVAVVALGTNGLAPTFASFVQMQIEAAKANAEFDGGAYITSPGLKGTLMLTQRFSGTDGSAVWTDNNTVAGKAAYDSTQVQTNLTKGSGTNLHAAYFGFWSQMLIGEFGAMEILTDPYRLKKQGMLEVTSFQMIDIGIRHGGAFSVIKDAISAM